LGLRHVKLPLTGRSSRPTGGQKKPVTLTPGNTVRRWDVSIKY